MTAHSRPLPTSTATAIPEISASSRDDLFADATFLELDRGDAPPSLVGYLVDGVVGVADAASDGRELVCALFHSGDLIDLRRTARRPQGKARALTAVRIIVFDAETVDAVVEGHADLAAFWIHQLREQFGALRDHCADLSCKTPIERLAAALLELRRWPESRAPDQDQTPCVAGVRCDRLRLPILRNDIAGYIGVKPETVSRAFRKLEEERLIEIERKDLIRLTDLAAIKRIANGGRPRAPTR